MQSLYFQNKKVLVGITGGIAAYKACLLVRELQNSGAEVRAVMTKSAQKFVGKETFKALTRFEVFDEIFDQEGFAHIDTAQWADLYVIAPCTANSLAKITHGMGDDAVSLSYLALDPNTPKVVVPAMNPNMYQAAATQTNLQTLRARGDVVVDAEAGLMACGDVGMGRFPEIDVIMQNLRDTLREQSLKTSEENVIASNLSGKKVLITAGRTEEAIDPVRSIINKSSGKTAVALAGAFYDAGLDVTFVHGPMDVSAPSFSKNIEVKSAIEMYNAVVYESEQMDVLIMNAAVADFRPKNYLDKKIKGSSEMLNIELEANPNILQSVVELREKNQYKQIVVGFALETDDAVKNAQAKLAKSPCDLLVLNLPAQKDSGFGKDIAECAIVYPGKDIPETKLISKFELSRDIVLAVNELF